MCVLLIQLLPLPPQLPLISLFMYPTHAARIPEFNKSLMQPATAKKLPAPGLDNSRDITLSPKYFFFDYLGFPPSNIISPALQFIHLQPWAIGRRCSGGFCLTQTKNRHNDDHTTTRVHQS